MSIHRDKNTPKTDAGLRRAMLWSVAFHGLVLLLAVNVPAVRLAGADTAALVAQLVSVKQAPELPPVPAAPAPVPRRTAAPPTPVVAGAASPAPSFVAPAPDAPSLSVAAPMPAIAAAVAPMPAESAANGAAATPSTSLPSPGAAGVDGDGLRSYRIALASQARRFKRYPPQARAAGQEGTAVIRLQVDAVGGVTAGLESSSRHDALDRAALAMIDAAAARTVIPPSLRGTAFVISLPVVFELEER